MSFENFCKQDQNIEMIFKKINKGNRFFSIYVWMYQIVMILCFIIGVFLGTMAHGNQEAICLITGIIFFMISLLLSLGIFIPRVYTTISYKCGRQLAMRIADLKEYEFDYFNEYLRSHEFNETCDLLNIPYQNKDTIYFLFEGEEHKMELSFLAREEREKILEHKKIDLICKFQWSLFSYDDVWDKCNWPIQFEKVYRACPNYKRI